MHDGQSGEVYGLELNVGKSKIIRFRKGGGRRKSVTESGRKM